MTIMIVFAVNKRTSVIIQNGYESQTRAAISRIYTRVTTHSKGGQIKLLLNAFLSVLNTLNVLTDLKGSKEVTPCQLVVFNKIRNTTGR